MTRVLTVDVGTTAVKAAVLDDRARVLGTAATISPVQHPRDGWAEQRPAEVWDAVGVAARAAIAATGFGAAAIDAIVFIGTWKAIIPVDAQGEVLHDAIIWMDARAGDQARQLTETLGREAGTGQEYWPRLMWLRQERPEVWSRARWILGWGSYFRWRATGEIAGDASDDFTHEIGPDGTRRFADVLAAADLDAVLDRFPAPRPAADLLGGLTTSAAAHLGAARGTPVVVGFSDLAAVTIGAAPLEIGATHASLGTSGWVGVVTAADRVTAAPLSYGIDGVVRGALYPLQSACLAYDWAVDLLYGAEKAEHGEAIARFVDAQVAEVPAGSGGLLATPWLTGELPPLSKSARAVFVGLGLGHDRRHLVRAVMEGVCSAQRAALESAEAETGETVSRLTVVGGGSQSAVWMQMLADMVQRPVEVAEHPRLAGLLGGLRCALVALGEADSLAGLAAPEVARRFDPDPARAEVYDRIHALAGRLFPALSPTFDGLRDLADQEGSA